VTKAPPDQVVSIRLELQSHEREQLETLVAAHAVGDVLTGVGAVIAPFGTALSVVLAAIVAKHGWDYTVRETKGWTEKKQAEFRDVRYQNYVESGSDLSFDDYEEQRLAPFQWFGIPYLIDRYG